MDIITDLLERGVAQVNVYEDLKERLQNGDKLRIKFGIDPTGSDLTLGHAVPLRKLKHFQDAGHQVCLLFGTFTGQIGDPTGKSQTRPQLTRAQIDEHVKTYLEQAAKVLDVDNIEVVYNHEWLEGMNFADVLQLAGNFTVAQMLERDMFQERIKAGKEINLTEFMYPLMQGYDSVPMKADVELGGTDQLFNMMAARPIQKSHGMRPQNVMTVPILVGLDGTEKMSKSLGNYIALNDSAQEMFGKTMSIPDEAIGQYFELATDVPLAEIAEMKKQMDSGSNPRDFKMRLGREIVALYHGSAAAEDAQDQFIQVFQKGQNPDEIELKELGVANIGIVDLLVEAGLCSSKSEARRMVEQGGVKVDDLKVDSIDFEVELAEERLVRAGKRKFMRVVS